jgi:hypothetical protein
VDRNRKSDVRVQIFHTGLSRGAANPDADTTSGRETAVETALALTRIFHTDRDEETGKADGVRQTSILMPGCMLYILSKSKWESNAASIWLPGLRR